MIMSQMIRAILRAPQSEWLLRWQVTVNGAFVGGSLIAALFQLGVLVVLALVRSAAFHAGPARCGAKCHA
jgi:hypothetical protein